MVWLGINRIVQDNPWDRISRRCEVAILMSASEVVDNQLIILMPVYNDWEAFAQLLPSLAHELSADGLEAAILLVDDGSTIPIPKNIGDGNYKPIESIEILQLRRNLGHQRAIAFGLSYIDANRPSHHVVVMDCDGEDNPHDVPRLIRECWPINRKIYFAARARRSDGFVFILVDTLP